MKIIGHRGAAGLAPENTLAGLKAAQKAGVDAIEFDVRVTADNRLVLCHDDSLMRTFGVDKKISTSHLEELADIRDAAGNSLPTLETVIQRVIDTPLVIEGKGGSWAGPLAEFLRTKPLKNVRVISFNQHELLAFHKLSPRTACYPLAHHNAMDTLNFARAHDLAGIDVNHWLLNPLLYWLCKRHRLDLVVYTVNNKLMAWFVSLLYPGVQLTTDVPDRLQFLRVRR